MEYIHVYSVCCVLRFINAYHSITRFNILHLDMFIATLKRLCSFPSEANSSGLAGPTVTFKEDSETISDDYMSMGKSSDVAEKVFIATLERSCSFPSEANSSGLVGPTVTFKEDSETISDDYISMGKSSDAAEKE